MSFLIYYFITVIFVFFFYCFLVLFFFFFQAEDGIRDRDVTGVQTCALPISCGVAEYRAFATPQAALWSRRALAPRPAKQIARVHISAIVGSSPKHRHEQMIDRKSVV